MSCNLPYNMLGGVHHWMGTKRWLLRRCYSAQRFYRVILKLQSRKMQIGTHIMGFVINRSLVKQIQQVIEEDGSVKDSASPTLKRLRNQVRTLEGKEVSTVDGRWCIKSSASELTSFKGLLLPSSSGIGSIVEPLSAIPLNDELQRTRALVSEAEAEVLLMLTEKMQMDLDKIEQLSNSIIQLDVVNARATYGLAFGGTCPNLFLPGGLGSFTSDTYLSGNRHPQQSDPSKNEWVLYMLKAYHPLLLHQHRQNLQTARKDLKIATMFLNNGSGYIINLNRLVIYSLHRRNCIEEIKRKLQGEYVTQKAGKNIDISSLELKAIELEQVKPIPVDFFIAQKTRVLVITGPNTGGKTICLKTVGLAAMMAKSGSYTSSQLALQEGREYSGTEELITNAIHQVAWLDIQSQSTSHSLVLLDEVGAGTNPHEGAALGMSLLESFAETGALLTIATTHHGELKTLKYSNNAFENACMEFDDVKLKPTYRILWGVPDSRSDIYAAGRSNAINIAERLGLPGKVVDNARELYGAASAGIDEVIIDMERLKQGFQKLLYEGQHHLMLSRESYEKLLVAKRKTMEHSNDQRLRKMREISEAAAMARSILHKKVRQHRASLVQPLQPTLTHKSQHKLETNSQRTTDDKHQMERSASFLSSSEKFELPKVGNVVFVSSLGKKATVLKVEPSKEEIVVQAGNMKLKLKLDDIKT
ncbi:DNA mismatch repair protein MutS, type 2 [Prunus dulcis]|uniref:DNA mismatch repair protein MutS, type 2 n=1 Tax=Prunus dulcis TaxID=3755 RepID=A0A4Y1R330_PRUDU|nr:DNA mismatch repair protein MutS, type 2 [Prunus dulcis]